ncbi:MAG TPA: thiamine pyrophosphate-dependent enzyme [Candidatus Eremiobacteraeota bacterium]|nr:thiamine pyrophosphate-dependent enzyme [Candidatus Eremiobacteraeota bacterium]
MKYRDLIKKAFLIRKVEEKLLFLFTKGDLYGTIHTCIGQEWTGIAAKEASLDGDCLFSNHRCHGHFLAWTGDLKGFVAEIMGRKTGVCGGKGGSQHLYRPGFYSNGILGGMSPVSAGKAWSEKMKRSNKICILFLGDGALGEGVVYETLNIISRFSLPLLVVFENNRYAQSTSQKETLAGSIKDRAKAFNIEYRLSSTWEWEKLLDFFKESVNFVRTHSWPCILEIETYRLKSHSKGDDYRDPGEIKKYEEIDPLNKLLNSSEEISEILKEVEIEVEKAVDFAGVSDLPVANSFSQKNLKPVKWKYETYEKDRIGNLINLTFRENCEKNSKIIFIGEDLKSPYGGAFRITKDLSYLFPERVINMPVSEAALIGTGTGFALGGYIPVVEIMFGDFLTLGFDQLLNHACKFQYMYDNKVKVPLIVRTPMGGKRGYGPTHSQSLEKYFLGIPYLDIIALNCRISPRRIYNWLFDKIVSPTLVIENKVLYTRFLHTEPITGFDIYFSDEIYPAVLIKPSNKTPDFTIFCYGGMLEEVEQAIVTLFEDYEIFCEVICPSVLHPLNIHPLLESVEKSRKILLVEEGSSFAGLSSEVIAQIMESGVKLETVKRISWNNFIPSSYEMEKSVLPGTDHIVKGVVEWEQNL